MGRMLIKLLLSLSGQVESCQIISGTEKEPGRTEKGQFLTSARTRSGGRLGARRSVLPQKHHTHYRQINLLQSHACVWRSHYLIEVCVCALFACGKLHQ